MAYQPQNIFGSSQYLFPNAGTTLPNSPVMASEFPSGYGTGSLLTDVDKLPANYGTGAMLQNPAAASSNLNAFGSAQNIGLLTAGMGAINTAVGSYFAAQNQQSQLRMQAQNQKFASQMSALNAQGAEYAAQSSVRAGQQQYGRMTMQQGQARASAAVGLASRGIQAGVGSAKEVMGSIDLINNIDRLTMNSNIVRQAEAYRMQKVNYLTESSMQNQSSRNLKSSADSISPGLGAYSSLMGGASDIGMSWLRTKRFEELLGGVSNKRM